MPADALRATEQEQPAGAQRIGEQAQHAPLRLLFQVDEQIPAAHQVEPCERRIADNVLGGEYDHLANALRDAKPRLLLREEPLQACGAHVGGDSRRIAPGSRDLQGVLVQIRREDLHRVRALGLVEDLAQQDRQREGFLARGAARHPGADRPRRHAFDELAQLDAQGRERVRVAEEAGDTDQELLEQRVDLGRCLDEESRVGRHRVDAAYPHATLDPPVHGRLLVRREVVPRPVAQGDEHAARRIPLLVVGLGHAPVAARVAHDLLRDASGRRHEVHQARPGRALRHARVLGAPRVLCRHHSTARLDLGDADRPVAARARQHDCDRVLAARLGERAEEVVDRQVCALRRGTHADHAGFDGWLAAGRVHVHAIGFERHPVHGRHDADQRVARQQLRQNRRLRRVLVRHHDERDAAVRRHRVEERLQRREPTRGRADADDRQCGTRRGRSAPRVRHNVSPGAGLGALHASAPSSSHPAFLLTSEATGGQGRFRRRSMPPRHTLMRFSWIVGAMSTPSRMAASRVRPGAACVEHQGGLGVRVPCSTRMPGSLRRRHRIPRSRDACAPRHEAKPDLVTRSAPRRAVTTGSWRTRSRSATRDPTELPGEAGRRLASDSRRREALRCAGTRPHLPRVALSGRRRRGDRRRVATLSALDVAFFSFGSLILLPLLPVFFTGPMCRIASAHQYAHKRAKPRTTTRVVPARGREHAPHHADACSRRSRTQSR